MLKTNGRTLFALVLLVAAQGLFTAAGGAAQAQQQQDAAAEQAARRAFHGPDLEGKDGPMAKIGAKLARLYHQARQGGAASAQGAAFEASQTLLPVRSGHVRIDAVASAEASGLRARLDALGLRRGATAAPVVSGWLPVEALAAAARIAELRFARPSLAKVRGDGEARPLEAGAAASPRRRRRPQQQAPVVSQGVAALQAAEAREQFGVTGNGVTVGVLSDSFDCLDGAGDDEEAGEIPPNVLEQELSDCATSSGEEPSDEGRAMVQIIADVAPEAAQRFRTAFEGTASFANNIRSLAADDDGDGDGAQVIVDDIIYFGEPMFAVGPIAQAVNDVAREGAAYFSAAGNSDGRSYESDAGFRSSGVEGPLGGGLLHDFAAGGGTDAFQSVTLRQGRTGTITLQWAQPYASTSASSPGASSDLDLVLLDQEGTQVASATFNNVGNDPIEILQYENDGSVDADDNGVPDTTFQLGIERADGPPPEDLLKVVYTNLTRQEYGARHSTVYGHANAAGAAAVGAASWFNTPAFNDERQDAGFRSVEAAVATGFSARGGTPILFGPGGDRLPEPQVRAKPEVVGPDGGDNTFFGQALPESPFGALGDDTSLPNFFGTSAAAPHVAGVAALMRSLNPDLARKRLYRLLQQTADDMTPRSNFIDRSPGEDETGCSEKFDFKTGCGFVDARAALDQVPTTLQLESQGVAAGNGDGVAQVELAVETETPAQADSFVVERCFGARPACGTDSRDYERAKTIEATGQGRFTVTAEVFNPGTYTFLVRQFNEGGESTFSRTTQVTVELAEGETFALTEAFPNPFRSRTQMRLIVEPGETVDVAATLHDARGRRVRTFFEGQVSDQKVLSLDADALASGVYFVRVQGADFLETRSVVLVQ